MTLHLPQPLTDGDAWKGNKISSTHQNLNPSDVLDSMSQEEHMGKDPFWYFSVWPIVTLNA